MSNPSADLPQDFMQNFVGHESFKKFAASLIGRTITNITYFKQQDSESTDDAINGSPMIHLDDGTVLIATQDDECNGPGSIAAFKGGESLDGLPTCWW